MDSTALLLHVADVIEYTPTRYNQGSWVYLRDDMHESVTDEVLEIVEAVDSPLALLDVIERGLIPQDCGTTCCIGGHAVVAAPERVRALPPRVSQRFVYTTAALFDLDRFAATALTTHLEGTDPLEVADLLRQLAAIPADLRATTDEASAIVDVAVAKGV